MSYEQMNAAGKEEIRHLVPLHQFPVFEKSPVRRGPPIFTLPVMTRAIFTYLPEFITHLHIQKKDHARYLKLCVTLSSSVPVAKLYGNKNYIRTKEMKPETQPTCEEIVRY